MAKEVDLKNPVDPNKVLQPCCSAVKFIEAQPSITSTGEIGYVLDTGSDCNCKSRWFPHDWRKHGHAIFEKR